MGNTAGFMAELLNYITPLLKAARFSMVIIFLFIYHVVLKMDMKCPCQPDKGSSSVQCWCYMILPCFIILFIILPMDKHFQNCVQLMRRCNCAGLLVIFCNASCTAVLWVAAVFLDGDWYVCCANNFTKEEATLPCKKRQNLNLKEKATISELMSWSTVWGLAVVISIAFLRLISNCFYPCCQLLMALKCSKIQLLKNWCNIFPQYSIFYEENVFEQANIQMKEMLEVRAKDRVSRQCERVISEEDIDWEKVTNLPSDVIDV